MRGVLEKLFAGELFLMVHSNEVHSGAIGGFIRLVPEPASLILMALANIAIVTLTLP